MSKPAGVTVQIGDGAISTETSERFGLTRQARSRGMASVYRHRLDSYHYDFTWTLPEYGRVKLADVRAALDRLTLDESTEEYVPLQHVETSTESYKVFVDKSKPLNGFKFRLRKDGRVAVSLPCGATRLYQVRTLDRALTALGA